ncbi:MAG: hypothetical protein M1828_001798 [Chrysothrix sp. TS-e1954]|nr:MAG: hypothetical protein M1828_001798 [Chrysothrix sp. TS-e1954]
MSSEQRLDTLRPLHANTRRDSQDQSAPLHYGKDEDSDTDCKYDRVSLYDRLTSDTWWPEFLSWLLAAVLLVTLIILLREFQNKPLATWHSKLTFNTIIAGISQVVQMLLLVPIASCLSQMQWLWYHSRKPLKDIPYFQEASTGPFSGLTLVYKQWASLFVWLGFVCMLLQTLFAIFAQQSLSLPNRQIQISSDATIPRSLVYRTPEGSEIIQGSSFGEVVPQMKLAVFSGLLRDGVDPSEVQGSSTTGNATFEAFTSLGVCASVADVTSSIVRSCTNKTELSGIADRRCSYTVPALRRNRPLANVRARPGHLSTLYIGASFYQPLDLTDAQIGPINEALTEFYVIYVNDLSQVGSTSKDIDFTGQVRALKGDLRLCAHHYTSSMQFGVTRTILEAQDRQLVWSHGFVPIGDTNQGGYTSSVPGTSETFYMEPDAMDGLSAWLNSTGLTGTALMQPPPPDSGAVVEYSAPADFSTIPVKAVAVHLYGSEDGTQVSDGVGALTKFLDNIAMSMSNATELAQQMGGVYTTEIYFDVSWPWLTLPIVSVVITLALLVLTVRQSRRNGIPAWKSSQLAALQALNPRVRSKLGDGMITNSEMKAAVKKRAISVALKAVEGRRWELVD